MKVYVIFEGWYSDRMAVYVTSDKKKAEEFVEFSNERGRDNEWSIEEFVLDEMPTIEYSEIVWWCRQYFNGSFTKKGDLLVSAENRYDMYVEDDELNKVSFRPGDKFAYCRVKAKTKADAIKKSSDLFNMWLAKVVGI